MFHENTSVIQEVELGGVKLGPAEVRVIDMVDAALGEALLRASRNGDREVVKLIVDELRARREAGAAGRGDPPSARCAFRST